MEVVYEVRGVEGGGGEVVATLQRIISEHSDYIEGTTKGPVCPLTSDCDLTHMIVEEEQKVGVYVGRRRREGEEERVCDCVCSCVVKLVLILIPSD